jgi:hypothetical protein
VADNPQDKSTSEETRLSNREAKKLANITQRIEVKRGNAWVSLENEDIVIEPGEAVTIRSSEHSGVISPVGTDSMVFRVSDLNLENEAAQDQEIRLWTAGRSDSKTQRRRSRSSGGMHGFLLVTRISN